MNGYTLTTRHTTLDGTAGYYYAWATPLGEVVLDGWVAGSRSGAEKVAEADLKRLLAGRPVAS